MQQSELEMKHHVTRVHDIPTTNPIYLWLHESATNAFK